MHKKLAMIWGMLCAAVKNVKKEQPSKAVKVRRLSSRQNGSMLQTWLQNYVNAITLSLQDISFCSTCF